MTDLSSDLAASHYVATSTVFTGRRNLFSLQAGQERHIGTLVSGSRTKLERFDRDCCSIVHGLALTDVVDDILQALTLAQQQLLGVQRGQHRHGMTIVGTDDALRAVTTSIEKIAGAIPRQC